jgi:hypothetical protein
MPYRSDFVDPEILITYRDVPVYRTYRDDELDDGPTTFFFSGRSPSGRWIRGRPGRPSPSSVEAIRPSSCPSSKGRPTSFTRSEPSIFR